MPEPTTETGHLRRLAVEESSGVDIPAHLMPGWVVMKSASDATAADVLAALSAKENHMPDFDVDETEVEDGADERDEVIETLTDEVAALTEQVTSLQKALKTAQGEDEDTLENIYKEAPEPIRRLIDAERTKTEVALQKALVAEREVQKALDAKADAVAIEFVKSLTALPLDPAAVGPALRKADPDLREQIEKALTAADEAARTGGIFKSLGTERKDEGAEMPDGSTSWGRIQAIAKSLVADGKAASEAQAIADAVAANPDLYHQYLNEKGA